MCDTGSDSPSDSGVTPRRTQANPGLEITSAEALGLPRMPRLPLALAQSTIGTCLCGEAISIWHTCSSRLGRAYCSHCGRRYSHDGGGWGTPDQYLPAFPTAVLFAGTPQPERLPLDDRLYRHTWDYHRRYSPSSCLHHSYSASDVMVRGWYKAPDRPRYPQLAWLVIWLAMILAVLLGNL